MAICRPEPQSMKKPDGTTVIRSNLCVNCIQFELSNAEIQNCLRRFIGETLPIKLRQNREAKIRVFQMVLLQKTTDAEGNRMACSNQVIAEAMCLVGRYECVFQVTFGVFYRSDLAVPDEAFPIRGVHQLQKKRRVGQSY